jgi:hypothetical protein
MQKLPGRMGTIQAHGLSRSTGLNDPKGSCFSMPPLMQFFFSCTGQRGIWSSKYHAKWSRPIRDAQSDLVCHSSLSYEFFFRASWILNYHMHLTSECLFPSLTHCMHRNAICWLELLCTLPGTARASPGGCCAERGQLCARALLLVRNLLKSSLPNEARKIALRRGSA